MSDLRGAEAELDELGDEGVQGARALLARDRAEQLHPVPEAERSGETGQQRAIEVRVSPDGDSR